MQQDDPDQLLSGVTENENDDFLEEIESQARRQRALVNRVEQYLEKYPVDTTNYLLDTPTNTLNDEMMANVIVALRDKNVAAIKQMLAPNLHFIGASEFRIKCITFEQIKHAAPDFDGKFQEPLEYAMTLAERAISVGKPYCSQFYSFVSWFSVERMQ